MERGYEYLKQNLKLKLYFTIEGKALKNFKGQSNKIN